MTLNVSYMGTKRLLATTVAEVVAQCPAGPLLDVFAGMCSVANAVSSSRSVWCNDVQSFAATTAAAFFTSQWAVPSVGDVERLAAPAYQANRTALVRRFGRLLDAERGALNGTKAAAIRAVEDSIPTVSTCAELANERGRLARRAHTVPYRLFSITYGGAYFGLRQCIEIDSVRRSIDHLLGTAQIAGEQHRWLILALCQAISRVATTTGHFAQPLRVKPATVERHIAQRRRSVWEEWLRAIGDCIPVGSAGWRRRNRAFNSDALSLLSRLAKDGDSPAVIYADPPYTADQYSRFYHIYETLIRYDYPTATGVGRYRQGRYVSEFSRTATVLPALNELSRLCADLGSALVLSYPAVGLLTASRALIPNILKTYFCHSEIAAIKEHSHSSFGASKGFESRRVTEIVYLAY